MKVGDIVRCTNKSYSWALEYTIIAIYKDSVRLQREDGKICMSTKEIIESGGDDFINVELIQQEKSSPDWLKLL